MAFVAANGLLVLSEKNQTKAEKNFRQKLMSALTKKSRFYFKVTGSCRMPHPYVELTDKRSELVHFS